MQGERSAPRTTIESPEGVADRNQVVTELMERYYRSVVSFFYQRGFDVEESRDLAQETFSGMLRAIERYRGEGSLEAFLFSVANNILHNRLRRQMAAKRQLGPGTLELAEAGEVVATQEDDQLARLLAQERVALVEQAMQKLPPQSRRCLVLLLHHGLRYREIADLLEISIGTVKSHISNARRLLAKQLADRFGSP